MRKHGKTFYWASFFLDNAKMQAIYSIYSFCRKIDDMVDEAKNLNIAKKKLLIFIDAWNKGRPHPVINVLNNIPKENWPNQKLVKMFLNGQISDIKFTSFKSEKALIIYCYQVAGTVGLMVCDIFGVKDKKMRYFAIDLGIAMQLVNISRDIYEDSARNRIYLPESLIGKHLPQEIAHPTKKNAAKIDLTRKKMINLANIYFASASQAIDNLPRGAALAVKLASTLYQQIGYQLINTKYQHKEKRCYVTNFCKLLITLKIIAKFLITFKVKLKPHNKKLHKFITTLPGAHF
ncbi:MAG: phytoene/squalene synthase family protein [Candidatus Methylopumilus sp.]|nr:phytoene/squalene synthase family protein [Candidatus Methylopumilus sp.]